MRKCVKVLLACLLAALLATPALCDDDGTPVVKVKVTNKTDAKIFIAFGRTQTDSGGEDEEAPDCSKGWWGIDPGKTKTLITYKYSPFHSVFYYATSKGGKRVWAGKSGGRDHAFWIHPTKAFNVTKNRKVNGGKKVYFRYISESDYMNEVPVLNLTAK